MATFYVDPTSGSNSNDGSTPALAFLTVDYANGESTAGDTIQIVAGTHTLSTWELTEVRNYRGEVSSLGKNLTILDYQGVEFFNEEIALSSSISFLNIENVNSTAQSVVSSPKQGLWISPAATGTWSFSNVVFRNVFAGTSSTGKGDRGSMFVALGALGDVLTINMNNVIFDKVYEAPSAVSGYIFSCSTNAYNLTCENCIFNLSPGAEKSIIPFGEHIGGATSDVTARNTIFYTDSGTVVLEYATSGHAGANLDIDHADNIFFGTYTDDGSPSNVLTGDPQFVSVATGNFNLRPDVSPAINAGVVI